MSFINNLFGTIASGHYFNTNADFLPLNSKGDTISVKGEAQWLGLRDVHQQKLAYESVYPLASVVDRLAEMDLNGKVEILRVKGKGKEDYATGEWANRMNIILKQPNPLQSWDQFRGQQLVYKRIFGFCPVLPVIPYGVTYPISIVNLPPWEFDVEGKRNFINGNNLEDSIKRYKFTMFGQTTYLEPNQVMILQDGFILNEYKDYLLPQSRIVGLDMAVSNICAAMEADNVLLKKRGPLGFISHDAAATKDSVAGYLPMTAKEKTELQEALQQYGLNLSQYQYVISKTASKWNPMSFDVKQLGTKETIIENSKAICQRFGYPYTLFEESDATFANGNQAAKDVYQNTVIPTNVKDLNLYDKFFKAEENNATIKADFSWLPVLQEDEKARADAAKAWNEALLIEYENNLITKNQWLTARGYDTIEGGDVYYNEQSNDTEREASPIEAEISGN